MNIQFTSQKSYMFYVRNIFLWRSRSKVYVHCKIFYLPGPVLMTFILLLSLAKRFSNAALST